MTVWYVKRKPTGVSYFRDGFPYLEVNMPAGSMWVQTRAEACAFRSLKDARTARELAQRFGEDKDVMIVSVAGQVSSKGEK